MNRFFTDKKIYNERISICKKCEHYFKPTGNCKVCLCFMRVKARISVSECPKKYWLKTDTIERTDKVPKHLEKEVLDIYPDIKNGTAKDVETKARLIELYNTIYGTKWKITTNCGSCLHSIFKSITHIYNKLKQNEL